MKIVVIGGSGLIGSRTVARLRATGHNVVSAGRTSGVDTITGAGLADALAAATVVVDLSNSPTFEDNAVLEFFKTSSRNLLAAEAIAGVSHHVALSVVGTDRLQDSGYFRAKLAQETLIKAAPIPYTIVRATQFFEFMAGIAQSATIGNIVSLPTAYTQPIAAVDVADAMTQAALDPPGNATIEIAGPERARLNDLIARLLHATGDPREVVGDPQAPYFGIKLNDDSLIPGDTPILGKVRLENWLAGSP